MPFNPTFVKRLSTVECRSNELVSVLTFLIKSVHVFVMMLQLRIYMLISQIVPHAFCVKYGSRIPLTVKVVLRTGYAIWLDFDKVKERFVGLRVLFDNMNFTGGETVVFEHTGGFDFNVRVCDMYGSEINYPYMVHYFQTYQPSFGMCLNA